MPSTLFGEHLRREREMRGVSLEEISAATRIGTRFLEAIENDQWDQLPGGVFNRGFIRSIARFLGLDEDSLVAEYALGTNGKTDANKAAERPAEIPRNWGPAAIAAAVVIAVLLLSGLVVRQYYGRWIRTRLHRQHAEAVAGPPGGVVSGIRSSEATASLATGPPMPGAEDTLTLRIEADKLAEVSVSADGKTVFAGAVNANDAREFRARETFEITSNDSGAVRLELNGQTMPPLGASGQPGSQTLSHETLSTNSGEAH
jgi:transcriptional regulator with XRE-family HTH domain